MRLCSTSSVARAFPQPGRLAVVSSMVLRELWNLGWWHPRAPRWRSSPGARGRPLGQPAVDDSAQLRRALLDKHPGVGGKGSVAVSSAS